MSKIIDQERLFRPGVVPTALSVIAPVALALVVGAILFLRGCTRPAPIIFPPIPKIAIPSPTPSPSPQARTESTSSSSTAGKQRTVIRIPQASNSNGVKPEDIVLEFEQTLVASSSSSASITPPITSTQSSSNQITGIGVVAGTMPGYIAADIQVIKYGILGLDIEANLHQVGAGISIGTKAFGTGGVYQGFDGGRGVYVGAGLRF